MRSFYVAAGAEYDDMPVAGPTTMGLGKPAVGSGRGDTTSASKVAPRLSHYNCRRGAAATVVAGPVGVVMRNTCFLGWTVVLRHAGDLMATSHSGF